MFVGMNDIDMHTDKETCMHTYIQTHTALPTPFIHLSMHS